MDDVDNQINNKVFQANPVQMKQGQLIKMETLGPVLMDAIAVRVAMGELLAH